MHQATKRTLGSVLLLATHSLMAAPTTYEFDTVTGVELHTSTPKITGILLNSTTPTTVSFIDNTNGDYRYAVSRCVPIVLTALEKPGRYIFTLTIDPAQSSVQLVSCALSLKS